MKYTNGLELCKLHRFFWKQHILFYMLTLPILLLRLLVLDNARRHLLLLCCQQSICRHKVTKEDEENLAPYFKISLLCSKGFAADGEFFYFSNINKFDSWHLLFVLVQLRFNLTLDMSQGELQQFRC